MINITHNDIVKLELIDNIKGGGSNEYSNFWTKYSARLTVDTNNPGKGGIRTAAGTFPRNNEVIAFEDYMAGLGIFTYVKLTCRVNGTQRTNDRSYYYVR